MSGKKDGNIETLVKKAAAGDDKAMAALIAEIMPAAAAKASRHNSGNTRLADEDLIQEGMLGFLDSVKEYNPSLGVPFKAFAIRCIENRIVSALRVNYNKRNAPLTGAVSFDGSEKAGTGSDPVAMAENGEEEDYIRKFAQSELSEFEREVLGLKLQDMGYSEIAAALECTEKAVDNALQRIRRKLIKYRRDKD
ncbi:MAG: sigma-70 family RNA polymerase sigma factor [Clostridia bacterium]|nr:sigma-70 family RNA polymerase sigma factor [Clostridia bacterium]MBR6360842.1 sigma-70 family RNA polymerase sigma factor [Clostridia bacterium]MBR6702403.1 sigma-70 family RNA polymerase sigma factor [Clostridia bacterium]